MFLQSIYQTLSEIKAEVENVIATGRKIVKEGQSTDPAGLTQQLDQLKALYNQVGGKVFGPLKFHAFHFVFTCEPCLLL